MEVIAYKYDSDFPASLSKTFIDYVNSGVNGKLFLIQDGEIIVPLLIRKKAIFNIGYFVHIPLKNNNKLTLEEEVSFFKVFEKYLTVSKLVDFILPPIHIENFNHIPNNARGYKLGIISIQLFNRSIDSLFESFKSVYRRHIRNAEKANVEIKFGLEYFKDFYSIYSEKLQQENAVHDSYDTIKKIAFNENKDLNIQCGVAYLNGKIEAGILNFSDSKKAYYLFGGSSKEAHNGSFRLLHWELIKKYSEMGLNAYQLGANREGEMLTNKHERLASFKLGFGSVIQEGFHFTWIINRFKYQLYTVLLKFKTIIKR
jgi:hypothetical protein